MNKELTKLKNSLAIKAILKIMAYFILALIVIYVVLSTSEDVLANMVYQSNEQLYNYIVWNKPWILVLICITLFILIAFFVLRNTMRHITETIVATDKILKEPEKEIKLSSDLVLIENQLNKIRIDLITSQNAAKDAEQKKNDLIVYMAHDLKTPLTSVIGYITLLLEEKEIPPNLREKYMNIVLKKALRVEELTNQFFDITRYNLQKMPITKQKIDIGFLMEQLVEECKPMLEEKDLTCQLQKPAQILYEGDGDKLARAFENLLRNAVNYSFAHTQIDIIMQEKSEEIHILFRNQSEKIPEYKLEKLFDKFYRADEARSSSSGGSGLGLAITKQIIELHGGTISVKNENDYIEFFIILKNTKI